MPLLIFYLKQRFGDWLLSPVFRWNLLSLGQSIDLLPISGHQHQHKMGYMNHPQHKRSARVTTNVKNIKRTAHTWGLALIFMHCLTVSVYKIGGFSEYKPSLKTNSLYITNIKTRLSLINYTGRTYSFLTSAAITRVQMGEMSKLGWLIGWSTRDTWADSLYFL
jgi:hypothetical protein